MARIYYLGLLFFILFSCDNSKQDIYKLSVTNFNIEMKLKKNNSFLREYKRYLVISSKDNEELESVLLKDDNGTGANSYLYEDTEKYIIIDCDGSWYSINKKTGDLNLIGNFWLKNPPKNYLGTFMLASNNKKVNFIKQEKIKLNDIYKYGGG